MKCPKCHFEQDDLNTECIYCGIVFSKLTNRQPNPMTPLPNAITDNKSEKTKSTDMPALMKELIFYTQNEFNAIKFIGYLLVLAVIFIWGIQFMIKPMASNYAMQSFWHMVDLPFHEAGHFIFRPFGRLIASLGGSLGQLLMPLICLGVFLVKTRDTFAASFCLWWYGQNFVDLAPYINDARSLTLPLIGGNTGRSSPYGFHDWEFILRETGLISYDHLIANASHFGGLCIMILAYIWGSYILLKQYKVKNNNSMIQ